MLFASLAPGSPHAPRVRSGCSALSVSKLAATIAPGGIAF
ncbi:L-asparaginase [Klebsiella michiganensis]|nr:L-asparaginase [Klebsiella michiganensis]